jgi:murein DD-endopeptidase MepM/ murein hydrolase activator NlpD
MGTDVLAARAGRVVAIQEDPALGLMLVVEHEGGWRTIYGHLSKVFAELNQRVLSGTIIAAVGSTGLSTGPHLHFEIRMGTVHKDPSSLLPGKGP